MRAQKETKLSIFAALIKETASRWFEDGASSMSAALSFYTVFSLAPLLLLTVAIAGFVFGRQAAEGQIVDQLTGFMGTQAAQTIQSMMQAAQKPASGILATLVSVVTLLIGASGVLSELKDSLNRIWRVKVVSGIRAAIRGKILTFAMILAIGFLLLVSLVMSALMAAAGKYLGGVLPISETAMQLLNTVLSFVVITVLFAFIYKVLPDTSIAWSDVWIGSAVTSLLFSLGKLAIGLYLGKASVASSYGAAGSVLVVLLWVYYSAMILYFGAEFTWVYSQHRGMSRSSDDYPHSRKLTPPK
jgi:membrane protein